MIFRKNILLFLICLFLAPVFLVAQQTENLPGPSLESPYHTLYTHLYYLQADSYQPATAALTIQGFTDSVDAQQAAIKLKQIYDGKGLYVRMNMLPQDKDYIDSVTHKSFYTPFPEELPQIYLEKNNNNWLYASETIQQIDRLHQEVYPFGMHRLLNLLPKTGHAKFMGLALWQFIGLLVLLLLGWIVYKLLSAVLLPFIRRVAHARLSDDRIDDTNLILKIANVISLLIVVNVLKTFIPILQLPPQAAEWVIVALKIASTTLVVLLGLRIIRLVFTYAYRYAQGTEHRMDEQLLPILQRIGSILLVIIGAIHILRLLDVNVTALIAGVSIGGLALALAAQDTVKNLIGSAMIFIDRPFQIGDYIEVGGMAGTVTEVGFRSTRIRTSDTSIISIPNGSVANMSVTNKGVRVFRLFAMPIGITYATSPEQIQVFVEALRQLILNHPQTHKKDYYVHFNELSDSSMNILFRTFLSVPGYADELQVREEILLDILRIARNLKIEFAFPSSSIYVENWPGTLDNTEENTSA